MTIRRALPAEVDQLTQLARRAKASWGYPVAWLQEWEPYLEFSAAYLDCHAVYVAERDDEIMGVIAWEDLVEPEISHLWVAPEFQGIGVGRRLVEFVVRYARTRGWLSLRIESDPNAQRFYEDLGAVRVGEVSAPVGGTDRVLPVLRLPV